MVKEEENKKNGGWVKKPVLKSKQEERLDKMLYSLDLNIRKRGRILISEFDKVLSLVSVLQCCSPSQAVLMLKCCGEVLVDEDKQSRTRLLEKTLRLVKNINGMNLDISHYNTLLKVSQPQSSPSTRQSVLCTFRFIWKTRILSASWTSWQHWRKITSPRTE